MISQGPSKNTNLMEWDKIWSTNRDKIDPVCARYTCVGKTTACRLTIENGPSPSEGRSAPLYPHHEKLKGLDPKDKNDSTKIAMYGKELFIEKDDAVLISEGEKITLMKWGNVTITKKVELEGGLFHLTGTVDESDKDFKKT